MFCHFFIRNFLMHTQKVGATIVRCSLADQIFCSFLLKSLNESAVNAYSKL